MHFQSKCFYLIYIFNYIAVGSSELEFRAMALGHSGLLIYWDSMNVNDTLVRIRFTYKALTSKQGTSHHTTVQYTDGLYFTKHGGQYKLHSLNEDTEYEITANVDFEIEKKYTMTCKTSLKNNLPPEEPYFTWVISWNSIKITWVPCGKERNCHGNEAGTHFAVKYKILDSRETATVIEYSNATRYIENIYSGKIYEITVISINGHSETPSDSQEIFQEPCSGPVHSVRVLTLTNTSIDVSWKQPKWYTYPIEGYVFSIFKPPDKMSELHAKQTSSTVFSSERVIRKGLEPNIVYTFQIVPFCEGRYGFEYRFQYSIKAIQTDLPLVKSDFILIERINSVNSCSLVIFWIPCPEISDCKNESFGSDCEMKIQYRDVTQTYSCLNTTSGEKGWNRIQLEQSRTYKFIGKSVNKFNQTYNVYKRISCKGFEDE